MRTKSKSKPKTTAGKPETPAQPAAFPPITEQRFRTRFRWYDPEFKKRFNLDIVVMTADEWLTFPERASCEWGAKLLDNGCVIAACAKTDDDERVYHRAKDQLEGVEEMAALRHFRSRFLAFLESDPSLFRVELTAGADREASSGSTSRITIRPSSSTVMRPTDEASGAGWLTSAGSRSRDPIPEHQGSQIIF